MIKKLHEEWERLTEEVRAVPGSENSQSHQVLERMNAVSSALRRLTQGSVTRTTLSQAVRDALTDILRGEGDLLFPELASLKDRFASLEEQLGRSAPTDSKPAVEGVQTALKTLAGEVAGDVARLNGRLQGFEGALESKLQALEERILDRLSKLPANLPASPGGQSPPQGVDQGQRAAFERLEARVEESQGRAALLHERLDTVQGALLARFEELSGLVGTEEKQRAALGQDLSSVDDHLAEGLKDLEGRVVGRMGELETSLTSVTCALETRLRQSLAAAETRLAETDGKLEARFLTGVQPHVASLRAELLAKIAEVVAAQSEIETRLRSQWGSEMYQLEEKVTALVDLVGQVHAALPTRQLLEGLDDRLFRIESRFRTVTDQLEGLESAMPELKSLSEQLTGIRGDLNGLTGDLSSSEKDLQEVKETLARKVQDMQDLLRSGIERWEADRANQRQRLVDLRDTLRDQLQMALQRTEAGSGGLLGRLRARPDGGLRLDLQEWERFRARMETILQGLESLLTE